MTAKRRPATLQEAREIVQRSKTLDNHEWHKRAVLRTDGFGRRAVVHQDSVIVPGTVLYDTTVFEGNDMRYIICRRTECAVYNAECYYSRYVRYLLANRNGHQVWQATLAKHR